MTKLSQDQYTKLSDEEKCILNGRLLEEKWRRIGRPEQRPFQGKAKDAKVSIYRAGRGSGKTAAATHWLLPEALKYPGITCGILGPTFKVSVEVGMFSTLSGIMSILPDKSLGRWNEIKKILHLANGSRIMCFSSQHRGDIRGPEFHRFWVDELAELQHGMACWQIFFPAVRLMLPDGGISRVYCTGTPAPVPLMLELMDFHEAEPEDFELNTGSTSDNIANLDPSTYKMLTRQYEGTRYYAQEIEGKLLREAENALWTHETLELARVKYDPTVNFRKMAIGVDPALSSDKSADHTGIILGGLADDGLVYILGDYSRKASALDWCRDVIRICIAHGISTIVYEKNLAGPLLRDVMVKALNEMDAAIRLVPVQARGKKHARAEPTAALYEAGKVKHMPLPEGPGLDQLESQQATWEPTDRESPDRIDALVHLVEFLFKGSGATNILLASQMPWSKGRR